MGWILSCSETRLQKVVEAGVEAGEHAMLRGGLQTELGVGSRAQLEVPVAQALGIDRLVKHASLGLAQPCRICISAMLGCIDEKYKSERRTSIAHSLWCSGCGLS